MVQPPRGISRRGPASASSPRRAAQGVERSHHLRPSKAPMQATGLATHGVAGEIFLQAKQGHAAGELQSPNTAHPHTPLATLEVSETAGASPGRNVSGASRRRRGGGLSAAADSAE